MEQRSKKFWRILKWTFIVYVLVGALLYWLQDKLLFHPKTLSRDYSFHFSQPFVELNLPISKEHNLNVIRFKVDAASRKGVVLFFHGNKENVEHYAFYAPLFTRHGYEVWMMDYPKFGKTTGALKEQTLYADALILYKMAIAQMPSEKIIIYGKSLGTGVAAQLASVRDCKELILETPYYNIDTLAKHYFPIYPVVLTRFEFTTNAHLQTVHAPIYIFHGTDDGVIPYKQSKRLAEECKTAQLITIEGGSHNDLFRFDVYQNKMDSLLR
ncbi:MAG: alpha/beta hydrolase [Chitinophagaceae bacterium]